MKTQLLADRFLQVDGRPVIDLASNEEIWFRALPALSRAQEIAWHRRCETRAGVWHPHLAELIDYGALGPERRFEAFGLSPRAPLWPRRDRATANAIQSAASFLHRRGLGAGPLRWDRVRSGAGRPVLEPNDEMNGALEKPSVDRAATSTLRPASEGRPDARRVIVAIELQPRMAVRQIIELLDTGRRGWMRCVSLAGSRGTGRRTAWRLLAREARLRGFVPVRLAALHLWPWLLDELRHLHVLLLDDGAREERARLSFARVVLSLGLSGARPHVIVTPADRSSGFASVALEPISTTKLLEMVSWWPAAGRLDGRAIREAARRSGGNPGLFVSLLQYERAKKPFDAGVNRAVRTEATARVAESPSGYSSSDEEPREPCFGLLDSRGFLAAAPVSYDATAARARARLAKGVGLLDCGAHAAGARLVREAIGALTRRGEHEAAGRAALELGRWMHERGRTDDAVRTFQLARSQFESSGQTGGTIVAAAWAGLALIEQGRLADAEAAIRAARVAAATGGVADDVEGFTRVALARCLFWEGLHDGASSLLERTDGLTLVTRSIARRLAARLALRRRDYVAAGRLAAAALDDARACDRPAELASAHAVVASVRGAIGDPGSVREHVREGLVAARRARAPLRALRLRIVLLESVTRAGDLDRRAIVARCAHRSLERVPPLLRARLQHALAAAADGARAVEWQAASRTFIRVSGAKALESGAQELPEMDVIQELLEVLRVCHESEDEPQALGRVCSLIRDRLHASAAGFIAGEPEMQVAAAAGAIANGECALARRILDSGLSLPAAPRAEGLQAGSPVRYGGRTIAALVARWPIDAPINAGRAADFLSAAAAASAPSVRAVLDQLVLPTARTPEDLHLLGVSAAIEQVRAAIVRAAPAPFPVLVEGESGSGKELVARAVHRCGPRRERKYCALNCAALTDELLEAELFGHARGAFTGALTERTGLFEEADAGTLFLDEVGELSGRAQAKLLRAIQEGEIRRIGENFSRRIDVRVIAATNRSLRADVAAGRFRQDLLYRLDVVRIAVPALRDRVEDIPLLAAHFWRQSTERIGSRAALEPATIAALARYEWPGNVRELQNVLAALAVQAPRRGRVGPAMLPATFHATAGIRPTGSLEEARRIFERRYVRAALVRAGGHRGRAAADLGLSRQGLAKLLVRLKIDQERGQNHRSDTSDPTPPAPDST